MKQWKKDKHFWKVLIKRKTKSEDCLMQKEKNCLFVSIVGEMCYTKNEIKSLQK